MLAALTVDGDEMADIDGEFKSADQIANDLVTLSMLPESRWANLLKLDIIRYRNRLKGPPKIQVSSMVNEHTTRLYMRCAATGYVCD